MLNSFFANTIATKKILLSILRAKKKLGKTVEQLDKVIVLKQVNQKISPQESLCRKFLDASSWLNLFDAANSTAQAKLIFSAMFGQKT